MALDIVIVWSSRQDLTVHLRRALSRIWIRLLAFNILLVFLPAIGLFYFQVYEKELLDSQEQSMVQQGRLLAAALAGSEDLARNASSILDGLYPETISRLRIIDRTGAVLADSSRARPPSRRALESESQPVTEKWLYKVGQTLFNFIARIPPSQTETVTESLDDLLKAPEIVRALEGSYGANWRVSPGQRSVTLYSAIPIRGEGEVLGVVLV